MNGQFRVLVGLGLLAVLLTIPGWAAGASSAGASSARSASDGLSASQAYFVQLDGEPSALGGSKSAAKAARDAFFKNAAAMGVGVVQRQSFDTLWNGVSVNVAARDAGALATIPGVQAVYPVNVISLSSLPSGTNPEPAATDGEVFNPGGGSVIDDVNSSSMIGADIANTAGETGAGVKVAIIDSGIDYNHPDLGGCFGSVCKVVGGWDFVGNSFDSNPADSTYQPVPHPDADPAPCDPNVADAIAQQPGAGVSDAGHGTHVAGIVAAKAAGAGGVSGVAPDATLLAYRVFGCNGSTSDDIIIAALERAFDDGAQVVNMSLGDAFNNFASSPDAQATQTLVDHGVVVVAAAGNSGANGLFSTGAPSVAPGAISVASVNNLAFPAASFDAVSGTTVNHVAYAQLQTTATAPTTGTAGDFVYVGRGCVADPSLNLANDDPYLADPSGKVALIIRGVCTFNTKYARAVAAGAKAVVIMNDGANAGRIGLFFGGSVVDKGVPGVTISFTDGMTIRGMIDAGTTSLNWTANTVQAADPAAGQISSFSSWGFASDLKLKPDVAAPGGNIRSTWPLSQDNGYNVISGTSMASPHVAGAVADYLQVHAGATPAQVKAALSDTSVPIITPAGARENPALQGSGLIRVDRAVTAPVTVSPSNISLGDGHGGTAAITLTNNGSTPITYTLGNNSSFAEEPFLSDGVTPSHMPYTFAPFFFGNTVTFSAPTVTVPAHASASVNVTIAEPGWDPTAFYGGFIRFTPATGQQLTVPYAGYVGDYQAISPIASGNCSLPMLAHLGASTDKITCDDGTPAITGFTGAPAGGTWNRPSTDPVVLLWHLDYQVQELKVTLVDAATGQPATTGGRNPVLFDVTGVARSSAVNSFSGLVWDGTISFTDRGAKAAVHRRAAPGGTYKLVLTATKVKSFTDSRPNETQVWTSPAFTLRSP
jgi:minor extracellular serine protease Vpr